MNKTEQHKKAILKALESSLGVVTTACKTAGIGRTQYYQWLKDDTEFKAKVEELENIQKDFIKSKYYECVKDKVPSVVIHAAKNILGWNETNKVDITSDDKPIVLNIGNGVKPNK